jgi:hypothetical protein
LDDCPVLAFSSRAIRKARKRYIFLTAAFTPRVFLLEGIVYFCFAPLIALKNCFSDFALHISHGSDDLWIVHHDFIGATTDAL